MRNVIKAASAAALCLGMGSQALAHSTFLNGTATAETTTLAVLQVPHGCGGKATTEVQMVLPEGFIAAKPQPKSGWDLEVIKGDYKKTYSNHGTEIKSGPVEIRWKGGNLADEFYDTFVVQGKFSGIEAGTSVAFPVTQLCGKDASVTWTEVAAEGVDPHSLKNPAPLIRVVAKEDAAGGGHGGHAAAKAIKAGDLELDGAFIKAMLPGQPVAGGFVTINNAGHGADRLVSAASPAAGTVEIHEMAMQGDVMKMRKLDGGIEIPAGGVVELKPGGLHFMFMAVRKPFREGDTVPVRLVFEKAGQVDLEVPVKAANGGEHQH